MQSFLTGLNRYYFKESFVCSLAVTVFVSFASQRLLFLYAWQTECACVRTALCDWILRHARFDSGLCFGHRRKCFWNDRKNWV